MPTQWSWTLPTQNTDGTTIPAGEITGLVIGVRSTTAAGSVAGTYPITVNVTDPTATSETFAAAALMLSPDTYQSAINVLAGSTSSGFTTEAPASQFVIAAPVPNPCTNFAVA